MTRLQTFLRRLLGAASTRDTRNLAEVTALHSVEIARLLGAANNNTPGARPAKRVGATAKRTGKPARKSHARKTAQG